MIRRALFVLLFAIVAGASGTVGYFTNDYLRLKRDYEDLRVISRNMLMENERYQETSRTCLATLTDYKTRLSIHTMDLDRTHPPVPMKLAQGR
jgi:hypothetical protein